MFFSLLLLTCILIGALYYTSPCNALLIYLNPWLHISLDVYYSVKQGSCSRFFICYIHFSLIFYIIDLTLELQFTKTSDFCIHLAVWGMYLVGSWETIESWSRYTYKEKRQKLIPYTLLCRILVCYSTNLLANQISM